MIRCPSLVVSLCLLILSVLAGCAPAAKHGGTELRSDLQTTDSEIVVYLRAKS